MTALASVEVGEPILNSPYDEPSRWWQIEEERSPELKNGRRPAGYFYRDPKAALPEQGFSRGEWEELQLVNLVRLRVALWRDTGYPGATRTTLELLGYWRREGRGRRLFFAQLEAAETLIFLTEARSDFKQGVDVPPDPGGEFRRYACKMATGSGKTTVMGMVAAWSILNKVGSRGDARFSDLALVVCPNVTIRNRLRELDPNEDEASIYRTADLVPPHLMTQLRKGRVLVKNWHDFERKGMSAGARVQKNGVRETTRVKYQFGPKTTVARGNHYISREDYERRRISPDFEIVEETDEYVVVMETRYVESDTALIRRILGPEVGGKQNILVLNDEAHHAYRMGAPEEDQATADAEALIEEEAEEFEREATVWVDGLDRIHRQRGINICVDLSATPFFLARAGQQTNRIFPWVVSDFGLTDAIESGLVKIPQLAVADPTGAPDPAYFNLWRWIMGQLTTAERGGKRANPKPEAVLKHAHIPTELMADDWLRLVGEWAREGEERPPVFILVCKNTKLADVVYRWLGEGEAPSGVPEFDFLALRNIEELEYTIRVDSKVVGETTGTGAAADRNAWMRFTLDTVGKRAWPEDQFGRPIYPEGFEALADKLGKPKHPPGRDVRCIVSVGMLTEGWDCTTVTHIIGLRPFMSQLLCEQVVGRGLRRRSYEVGADGLLQEEVAKVLGVPFEIIPFKQSGKKSPPQPQHHVQPVEARADLEITFPRVEGYHQAIRSRVTVDWDSVAGVKIDPLEIPNAVLMKAGLPNNAGRPSIAGPGKLEGLDLSRWRQDFRLQEREFEMAKALTKDYVASEACEAPAHVLFPQLLRIVQRFVRERVEAADPDQKMDVFLSPYYGYAVERLVEAIRPDASQGEAPEVPRYERSRPTGSTVEVDLWTSKPVKETLKSHLNYVVADTQKWEQSAAYYLEESGRVVSYAKNQGLGFFIPYLHDGQQHDYIPDFLVRLDNGVTLIIETKGHDPLEAVKRAAAERWVDAVNAGGSYGEWRYAIVHDPAGVPGVLEAA